MIRAVVALLILAVTVGHALAQQPAKPAAATPAAPAATPLSPEAFSRLHVLELERQVLSLQQQNLEKDYRDIRRRLTEQAEQKTREVEEAVADEAAKAKVDPKAYRPDLATKSWQRRAAP